MGVRAVQIRHFYGKGSLAAVLAGAGVLAIGYASGGSGGGVGTLTISLSTSTRSARSSLRRRASSPFRDPIQLLVKDWLV